MRRPTLFILIILLAAGGLWAQASSVSAVFMPPSIFVNSLNTAQFDPVNPENQPLLTSLVITNRTNTPFRYMLTLNINWNNVQMVSEVRYKSKEQLQTSVTLTNRDFINKNEGDKLYKPVGDISFDTIINSNSILRDALQAGNFPDGTLTFNFKIEPINADGFNPNPSDFATVSFTITVKNISAIFLSYPGKPIGQTPPVINLRPITFMWNSVTSAYDQPFRKYRLIIREFASSHPPTANSVETTGRKVYDGEVASNVFTDFLPFQNNYIYAWQVTTGVFTESSALSDTNASPAGTVKSDWYVFRYVADTETSGSFSQLKAALMMLNNETIQDTFAQGYDVTGAVFYEGRVYTGKEAVDLVKSLAGKEIEVELQDN